MDDVRVPLWVVSVIIGVISGLAALRMVYLGQPWGVLLAGMASGLNLGIGYCTWSYRRHVREQAAEHRHG